MSFVFINNLGLYFLIYFHSFRKRVEKNVKDLEKKQEEKRNKVKPEKINNNFLNVFFFFPNTFDV